MKNFFITAKSTIGLFAVIVILFLALGNYKTAEQMDKNKKEKDCKESLKITDRYDTKNEISLYEFFDEPDSLNKLQNAYPLMLSHFGSQYLEIGEQYVEYIGLCDLDEKFIAGGLEAKNQEIEEINKIITPLNTVQLGRSTINNIELNKMIESGREFTIEDFALDDSIVTIPLILGNNYKNQFEINDSFSFFYLGKEFSGNIIAFLSKDSAIKLGDTKTMSLDNTIVMPSFEINTNYSNADFNKTQLLVKTEGYVLYENKEEYQNIIDKIELIKESTGIQYSYIEDIDFMPLNQCYFMPKYLAFILVILGELLFFFYIKLILKVVQRASADSKTVNILYVLFFMAFATYQIAYLSIKTIKNNALLLNIMRIRFTVLVELLIALAVIVIFIICKTYKKFTKRGLTYESNRCD